jgi:hypothetical protein
LSEPELITLVGRNETLVRKIITDLANERFIRYDNNQWRITS